MSRKKIIEHMYKTENAFVLHNNEIEKSVLHQHKMDIRLAKAG